MDEIANNSSTNSRIQNKLTEGKLLNEKGELIQCGYSTELIRKYDRNDIKAASYRIKEWDYYFITNGTIGLALTLGDIGYIGSASVTLFNFDLNDPSYKTQSDLTIAPFGKFNFPSYANSIQKLEYNSSKIKLKFDITKEQEGNNQIIIRHLTCNTPNFDGKGNDIVIDIKLKYSENDHSMVIATPFNKAPKAFYYNCKINNMLAEGTIKLSNKTHLFNPDNSLAVLDWGRGVWVYEFTTWYWGSLSSKLDDGRSFGFNIGYGFGNTAAATENMLFLNGVSHKIDEVEFCIPKKDGKEEDYMKDWKFKSNDNRLTMDFKPIINRYENTNLLIIKSTANQVFGLFTGTAILDDGEIIQFKDKLGFAEKVCNKW